jgi:hypothetical protein
VRRTRECHRERIAERRLDHVEGQAKGSQDDDCPVQRRDPQAIELVRRELCRAGRRVRRIHALTLPHAP